MPPLSFHWRLRATWQLLAPVQMSTSVSHAHSCHPPMPEGLPVTQRKTQKHTGLAKLCEQAIGHLVGAAFLLPLGNQAAPRAATSQRSAATTLRASATGHCRKAGPGWSPPATAKAVVQDPA